MIDARLVAGIPLTARCAEALVTTPLYGRTMTEHDKTVPQLGVAPLDEVLHGLYWGENIMWTLDADEPDDLVRALLESTASVESFERRLAIALPPATTAVPPGFERLDVPGGLGDVPAALDRIDGTRMVIAIAVPAPADAPSMFAEASRLAQYVLRRDLIAHWFVTPGTGLVALAQCLIEARGDHFRVDRADARAAATRGAILPYHWRNGALVIESPSAASLLGRGLRAARTERGWSQAFLGKLAGVSGSAISQAERGQHALALETVIDIATKMGVSVDQLLRGHPPTYELTRSDLPSSPRSHALLENPALAVRTTPTHIPPRGSVTLSKPSAGTQILLVGSGLVQVILPEERPILRAGDVLAVFRGGVRSCRNIGDSDALVFWQEQR